MGLKKFRSLVRKKSKEDLEIYMVVNNISKDNGQNKDVRKHPRLQKYLEKYDDVFVKRSA